MSVSSRVARASGKTKAPRPAAPSLPSTPYLGVDRGLKWSVFYSRMGKKKGAGGASRRGSHWLSDAGGCEVRWYWSHHVGLQSNKGNFYMDFGTLGHTALAYFYAQKMDRKPQWLLDYPSAEESLERDAQGNPSWLRSIHDVMEFYKRFEAGDPWEALYVEEEFEATVGSLDPTGVDEPAEDVEYEDWCKEPECSNVVDGQHVAHKVKKVWHFPNLNDEVVTCRPDMVVKKNGLNWIIDHKFQGGGRKDRERLPVIDDRYPDYTYYWQAMVNLHIVRKSLPVQGFIFNRVKRDMPFDVSRDLFPMKARQYAKVPATIRETVRRGRVLRKKALLAPATLIAHPWECKQNWECSYVRVCHVDTVEERNIVIATEFQQPET